MTDEKLKKVYVKTVGVVNGDTINNAVSGLIDERYGIFVTKQ